VFRKWLRFSGPLCRCAHLAKVGRALLQYDCTAVRYSCTAVYSHTSPYNAYMQKILCSGAKMRGTFEIPSSPLRRMDITVDLYITVIPSGAADSDRSRATVR
jgi:hypothetical protein